MRNLITSGLVSALATLLLIETILDGPYEGTKKFARQAWQQFQTQSNIEIITEDACVIPETPEVVPGSTAIIGHAYGSPNTENGFIAKKVAQFITDHATQLDAVIFSGDVFKAPSASRWARLASLSEELELPFHVAPGNHDVGLGENANRDIWEQSPFRLVESSSQPIDVSGFDIFLEDSVASGWHMSDQVQRDVAAASSEQPILLVRHNIAVAEMLAFANSSAGLSGDIDGVAEFRDGLPAGVTVISGDSGAFPRLPRYACINRNGLTFVANGIGEIDGDLIIILHAGKMFTYPI